MFSQNMLEMALVLLEQDESYEEFALKFVEHFFWIAAAMDPVGEHPDEMWDEEDGFFYDVLRLPDGTGARIKVRSLVGLLPLCATTVIEADVLERFPQIAGKVRAFLERDQDLLANSPTRSCPAPRPAAAVPGERGEAAARSRADAGRGSSWARTGSARSRDGISAIRTASPPAGPSTRCGTRPAESTSGMFGGNSNWRGPVWFPITCS